MGQDSWNQSQGEAIISVFLVHSLRPQAGLWDLEAGVKWAAEDVGDQ